MCAGTERAGQQVSMDVHSETFDSGTKPSDSTCIHTATGLHCLKTYDSDCTSRRSQYTSKASGTFSILTFTACGAYAFKNRNASALLTVELQMSVMSRVKGSFMFTCVTVYATAVVDE